MPETDKHIRNTPFFLQSQTVLLNLHISKYGQIHTKYNAERGKWKKKKKRNFWFWLKMLGRFSLFVYKFFLRIFFYFSNISALHPTLRLCSFEEFQKPTMVKKISPKKRKHILSYKRISYLCMAVYRSKSLRKLTYM